MRRSTPYLARTSFAMNRDTATTASARVSASRTSPAYDCHSGGTSSEPYVQRRHDSTSLWTVNTTGTSTSAQAAAKWLAWITLGRRSRAMVATSSRVRATSASQSCIHSSFSGTLTRLAPTPSAAARCAGDGAPRASRVTLADARSASVKATQKSQTPPTTSVVSRMRCSITPTDRRMRCRPGASSAPTGSAGG